MKLKNAELVDKGMKAYLKNVGEFMSYEISAGVNSEDSGAPDKNGFTMADKAIINEYGSRDGHIPERPVHRNTIDAEQKNMKRKIAQGAKKVAQRKVSALREANNIGQYYAGKLRDGVQKYNEVPNAPATVKKKGENNPLIDSGATVNAINPKITKKKRK